MLDIELLKERLLTEGVPEDKIGTMRISKAGRLITEINNQLFVLIDRHELNEIRTFDDAFQRCMIEFNSSGLKSSCTKNIQLISPKINNTKNIVIPPTVKDEFIKYHNEFKRNNEKIKEFSNESLKAILSCKPSIDSIDVSKVKFSKKKKPFGGIISCSCGFTSTVITIKSFKLGDNISLEMSEAVKNKKAIRESDFKEKGFETAYNEAIKSINSIEAVYWPSDASSNAKSKIEREKIHYLSIVDNSPPNFDVKLIDEKYLIKKETVFAFIKEAIDSLATFMSADYLESKVYRDIDELTHIKSALDKKQVFFVSANQWRIYTWNLASLSIDIFKDKIQEFFDNEKRYAERVGRVHGADVITQALLDLQDHKMGRVTLAKILSGSKSKDLVERNLDKTEWSGLLGQMKQANIVESIDKLIQFKIITVSYYGRHNLPLVNIKKSDVIGGGTLKVKSPLVPAVFTANKKAETLISDAFENGDWLAEFVVKAQAVLQPYSQAAKLLKKVKK